MTNPVNLYKLELALGQSPSTGAPAYTDVTASTSGLAISGGRPDPTQQMAPRVCTFSLDTSQREFDPFAEPGIRPNIPVRASIVADGNTRRRFHGFLDSGFVRQGHERAYLDCSATDRSKFVARESNLSLGVAPLENTSVRVGRILDSVGITSGFRDIGPTSRVMVAADLTGVTGLSALTACVATESLSSCWFVDREGVFRFDGRHAIANRPSLTDLQASFSNIAVDIYFGGLIPCTAPAYGFTELSMYNRVAVANALGETATAQDTADVDAYGAIRYPDQSTSSTISPQADADALLAAYTTPQNWVSAITYIATKDDAKLDTVAQLDLRDRVRVKVQPSGGGAVIDQFCTVEQINETVSPGGLYTVTLGLYPTAGFDALNPTAWWVLGDPIKGKIGTAAVGP